MRVATSQRLKELLWRDLEQGCAWAHLASVSPSGASRGAAGDDGTSALADSHWAARRLHVFGIVAALAAPLREHATALREGRCGYDASLVEPLAPLLQGVLRTYRRFLAADLAPLVQASAHASGYGQQTVLIGQLGGIATPLWLTPEATPRRVCHVGGAAVGADSRHAAARRSAG